MPAVMRVVVAFVLCGVLLTTSSGQQFDSGAATIRFVKNPEPAPDFTVRDVDGNSIASGKLRGKVVLLSFWATWCQSCLDEILDLIGIQARYTDRLQIIGLSLDYGPGEWANPVLNRVVQERGINYPVGVAPDDLQAKFGGILGLPTTILLDQAGRLVQKHVGVVNASLYETEIRALLKLPVAAKVEFFEDKGQVFAPNAKSVKELPGVDLSKLAPDRKEAALRLLNRAKVLLRVSDDARAMPNHGFHLCREPEAGSRCGGKNQFGNREISSSVQATTALTISRIGPMNPAGHIATKILSETNAQARQRACLGRRSAVAEI